VGDWKAARAFARLRAYRADPELLAGLAEPGRVPVMAVAAITNGNADDEAALVRALVNLPPADVAEALKLALDDPPERVMPRIGAPPPIIIEGTSVTSEAAGRPASEAAPDLLRPAAAQPLGRPGPPRPE
jgi:hypothetical protein